MKNVRKPVPRAPRIDVERVQTGVRLEKRMLKVLKAVAEYYDLSLSELLEDIVLHSFEGACAFAGDAFKRIEQVKKVYHMDYRAHDSYRFAEKERPADPS
jgi:hypothetical protein